MNDEMKRLQAEFESGLAKTEAGAMAKRLLAAEDAVATLTKERDDAIAKGEDAQKRVEALEKDRDTASGELEKAQKQIADLEKAAATKPKQVGTKAATPRQRVFRADADAVPLDVEELRKQLAAADDVEVVLVDTDGRELKGSLPLAVSGDVWQPHARGLMQSQPVEVAGPTSEPSWEIGGYALLVDGKHVATTMRHEPVRVGNGGRVQLVDDIYFG